ncbi:hypothetical protein QVD17_02552 [Tagetes erecta]|uniref:RING-type domain-containing protein n=1 Tax=Tagetes erecta TaxID=13708 RepID=A0AAD8P2I8_TARER|nr:hypothetical protein QVD17_02552 [Tagetes erecta]
MMGNSRRNEKGKAPAYTNSISSNVIEDGFESFLDLPLSMASWDDIHRSAAQGLPEPIGFPRVCSINPKSFQSPQINPSSNTANTHYQEVPLVSDWNMGWGGQYMNQGYNAISSGGISAFGGGSSFGSFSRPQIYRDVTGSSSLFYRRDTSPVHTRTNVDLNTNQSGVQGKFGGNFLSLGLGGTSETVSRSQLDSREIADKLNEAASNELKIARGRKATGQTFDGFMGSSPRHILQMQQNDRGAEKLTETALTELKRVHARKATGQTLSADSMGFQRNSSGFSNQFSNAHRTTSTNYEVGVHSMLNSGPGSSRRHALRMQQNDIRSISSADLDHYKGNESVRSGTHGGNPAHFSNSQQHNLNPPGFVKPSWMTSYHTPSEQLQHFHSTTANSPSYAGKQGQVMSQSATPTQVLGGNLSSQSTSPPQVSWVGRGLAGIDAPFPKRLGVESSVRNIPRSSHGHLAPVGPSFQNIYTDKGSTRMPHNVLRPNGRNDGAPLSYPVNYREPFFAHGQSQNELIQLPKGPQGAPSTNASSIDSQPQKLNFHARRHHKRTAVAPQSDSRWIQRQKIIHPIIHHSMPKPPMPVTTALVHPSKSVRSQTPSTGPVAAYVPPGIPYVSNIKPRVPVASAPAVSHITWKAPDATSKLSGYKCFLCKRDLALTSEGPVFQPAVAPPVAVLPCGHTFHDQCLQNITPGDQAKDPPCIPCAIGEN